MKTSWQFKFGIAVIAVSVLCACIPEINGSALEVSVGTQEQIDDYLDTGASNMQLIRASYDHTTDGDSHAELQIISLQSLMLQAQSNYYNSLDFSYAPDTFTVSGSGSSGVYQSRLDEKMHTLTLSGFSGLSGQIMQSDEFTVTLTFSALNVSHAILPTSFTPYYSKDSNGYQYIGISPVGSGQYIHCYLDCNTDYFYDGSYDINGSISPDYKIAWVISDSPYMSHIVYLGRTLLRSNSPFTGGIQIVAYNGVYCDLPVSTVNTSTPWEYYNNTLLPYIRENYDIDDIDNWLIYPDGYYPQDPTEPVTIPFLDTNAPEIALDPEVIGTVAEGEETNVFEFPTLPKLSLLIPDGGLDSLNLDTSDFTDGIGFWFAFTNEILTRLHMNQVVVIALILGAIGYILWKIGR